MLRKELRHKYPRASAETIEGLRVATIAHRARRWRTHIYRELLLGGFSQDVEARAIRRIIRLSQLIEAAENHPLFSSAGYPIY